MRDPSAGAEPVPPLDASRWHPHVNEPRTRWQREERRSTAGQRISVNSRQVIACEYPVSRRPTLEPHAVTPARPAHRQIACEDPTSALAVAMGWKADNIYSLRVFDGHRFKQALLRRGGLSARGSRRRSRGMKESRVSQTNGITFTARCRPEYSARSDFV